MKNYKNIPVLLLTFNRPDVTRVLIQSLSKIKPRFIYISQDGPRNQKDHELVDSVRDCFLLIDWDCDIQYLRRDTNLGCYDAVVGGINRFFEHVSFGIILEDDCIPNISFFDLCLCANIIYQNTENIGLVSGSNYQGSTIDTTQDYIFSRHTPLLWGWATWKNRRHLMKKKDFIKKSIQDKDVFSDTLGFLTKKAIKKYMLGGYRDSDWYMVCYYNNLLAIVPTKNHISNIGYIGIHNNRPGKYHGLPKQKTVYNLDRIDYPIVPHTLYDREMKRFMKKMYIYGIIEYIIKSLGLLSLTKKIIIYISGIVYKNSIRK